jgi:hypothetical protein
MICGRRRSGQTAAIVSPTSRNGTPTDKAARKPNEMSAQAHNQ